MNAQNKTNIRKETKRTIKADFERSPLKERLKAKFLSLFFLKKVAWFFIRLVLLVGISYIVLFPFFTKIAGSFMAPEDFVDVTVRLIPKNFSLDMYKAIWEEQQYLEAFTNTLFLSVSTALIQTFVCCFVAYGLAKFKFKGNKLVFLAVIFSLVVPHQTLQLSLFMSFRYFDIFGIIGFLDGGGIKVIDFLGISTLIKEGATWEACKELTFLPGVVDIIPESMADLFGNSGIATSEFGKWVNENVLSKITANGLTLTNTYWPLIIMSLCGLAFKNGLYIFMLRQFFRGVPDELEESAYIDGSGPFRTFLTIILPLSVPMMITVFLFAFSWQWTDDFYTGLFFTTTKTVLMPKIVGIPSSLTNDYAGQNLYYSAIRNTCGIMIIAPLIVMYLFCQRFLVQGIERSGLTAD